MENYELRAGDFIPSLGTVLYEERNNIDEDGKFKDKRAEIRRSLLNLYNISLFMSPALAIGLEGILRG